MILNSFFVNIVNPLFIKKTRPNLIKKTLKHLSPKIQDMNLPKSGIQAETRVSVPSVI